jgi:hypothetical protein
MIEQIKLDRVRQHVHDEGLSTADRPALRRSVSRALAKEGVVLSPQAWARLVREIVDEFDGERLADEVRAITSPAVFARVAEAMTDAAENMEAMEVAS